MSDAAPNQAPLIAIACGGTGGHLYPGLAVGQELLRHGCRVQLIISPKEVDQRAVADLEGMEIVTLPAVGLVGRRYLAFLKGFATSWWQAWRRFRKDRPAAVLAMGGFTAAPPVVAGKLVRARIFLHESNTIPGRANRLLCSLADQVFTWFSQSASHLRNKNIVVTGMPVRPGFSREEPRVPGESPSLLVMGGSQGARGVNLLVVEALELLRQRRPALRYVHLTGSQDEATVREAYERLDLPAEVKAHSEEMPRLLSEATLAVARAGASSLAELAAVRLPALLIPYPHAADNHQFFNAGAFERTGAALMADQRSLTAEGLAERVLELLADPRKLEGMRNALTEWHQPRAAQRIAEAILGAVSKRVPVANVVEAPKGAESIRETALTQA